MVLSLDMVCEIVLRELQSVLGLSLVAFVLPYRIFNLAQC